MSGESYREEYQKRIHKVQDYIERNYGKSFTMEELAEIAGFSLFHFSRIFQGILHESPIHYVNRIRMEQALFFLAHRQDKNITDIALDLGFTDSAVFSRAFRNFYDVSPSEYRREYQKSSNRQLFLSECKQNIPKKKWEQPPFEQEKTISFQELQEIPIIYVRHTGSYQSLEQEYPKLLQTLFAFADRHQLFTQDTMVLAMYHDNPEFGEETQYRTSLCMSIPKGNTVLEEGSVLVSTLEKGLYAVGHFQIHREQFEDAWDYMYQEWLNRSGYVPRNACPFEVYGNDPKGDEQAILQVDIYVPIEPLVL